MSATLLPSSRYLIITGNPTHINIIYPIEHISNTIVNFENPESGNYVYDVCREKTNLPLIKMNYLLTSCPPLHSHATRTLHIHGVGPEDSPTKINYITETV